MSKVKGNLSVALDANTLMRDVRFSVRALVRAKGFTIAAVFTLALGMFLTVTVWLYSSWALISNASYSNPESVYSLGSTTKTSSDFMPYQMAPQLRAYREQLNVFSEIAAISFQECNVVVNREVSDSNIARVWQGTLNMLSLLPTIGRQFLPEEYTAGRDDAVIISAKFWRDRFHSDPDILSRTLSVDGVVCRIVGVLNEKQKYPIYFYSDVYRPWVPVFNPWLPFDWPMVTMVRLRTGVTPEQAVDAMKRVRLDLSPQFLKWIDSQTPTLRKPNQVYRPGIFRLLFGTSIFLSAIAFLNTINLVRLRIIGRRREFSTRQAIGGPRSHIIRLIFIEVVIICGAAGLLVFMAEGVLMGTVLSLWTGSIDQGSLWGVWEANVALAVLVTAAILLIGIASTWRNGLDDLHCGLKDGNRTVGSNRQATRGRNLLVVLQASFTVILLAGAGLMIRTFRNATKVDLGVDPDGKVNVEVKFPKIMQASDETRLQIFNQLEGVLGRIPNVRAVGYGSAFNFAVVMPEGEPALRLPDGRMVAFRVTSASAHYPEAAGLHLLRGRWMSQASSAREIVINETLARNRFGEENPVGQVLSIHRNNGDSIWTVTGVVRDVRPSIRTAPSNMIYESASVHPAQSTAVVLNFGKDPPPVTESLIRRAVYKCCPSLIIVGIKTVDEQLKQSVTLEWEALNILRTISLGALLLTAMGLFSVLAYDVEQRKTEFGVRLALGASSVNIVGLVLREGVTTAGAGAVIGCCAAFGLARLMASLLFQTRTFEPVVYATVMLLFLVTTVVACWLPATRAARANISLLLRAV